jgi:tetratricopeptide (TPR) repeat protein
MPDLGRLLKPASLLRITVIYLVLMGLYATGVRAQGDNWTNWPNWVVVTVEMSAVMMVATVAVIFALVVASRGGLRAWQAGRLHAAGQAADALQGYNQVLTTRPDRAEALVGRAELEAARGNTAAALADLDHALAVTPHIINFPDPILYRAYLERGRLREASGDLPGALADWTQASRATPGAPDPYVLRGRAALERGDWLRGRSELATGVNLLTRALGRTNDASHRGPLLNMRGLAYNLLGEHRRALEDLKQALGLEPQSWVTHYNLGATYVNLGDSDEAMNELKYAIAINGPAARNAARVSSAYAPLREHPDFDALVGFNS